MTKITLIDKYGTLDYSGGPLKANQYDTKLTGLTYFQLREVVEIAGRLGVSVRTTSSTALIRVLPYNVLVAAREHHEALAGDKGRRQASASVLRKLDKLVGGAW